MPVVLINEKDEELKLGGAANVAWNCKELGARRAPVVGGGPRRARPCAREAARQQGVDASLHRDRGLSTTQKLRVIGRRQQLLRIDFEKPPSREVLALKLEEFKRRFPSATS